MTRSTILACALVAASGCAHSLRVTSEPAGARVLLDGKDTGRKTPASITPRALPSGAHQLTVDLEGYQSPKPRSVQNSLSPGLIVWSLIWWPGGIYNVFHGFSKTNPETLHFDLRDGAAPVADAPAATPSRIIAAPVERKRIANVGAKCAAMPLRMQGVAEGAKLVADDLVLAELQQSGFQAIGPDDVNAILGFQKTREVVGCDDASCAAELGAALGVDYLTAGNVSTLEGAVVLTLKLMDVKNTRVLARTSRIVEGGQNALPQMIGEAVRELVVQSGL